MLKWVKYIATIFGSLGKEFNPFLGKIPDFLSNFVNILTSALSFDGYMLKCKLGDHAGNSHGTIKPPKTTHIKQDKEDERKQNLR